MWNLMKIYIHALKCQKYCTPLAALTPCVIKDNITVSYHWHKSICNGEQYICKYWRVRVFILINLFQSMTRIRTGLLRPQRNVLTTIWLMLYSNIKRFRLYASYSFFSKILDDLKVVFPIRSCSHNQLVSNRCRIVNMEVFVNIYHVIDNSPVF